VYKHFFYRLLKRITTLSYRGNEAYVNRIVGDGSVPASVTLNDRQTTPSPTLRVAAGYRGDEDVGDWGERLRVDVRDDPRGNTTLDGDTDPSATSATLVSVDGFQIGSVVRFVEGISTFHYRVIIDVDTATRTISWTDAIAPVLSDGSQVTTAEFRLIVRYQETPTDDFTVVEDWRNLSMQEDSADYVVDRINHTFTGSRYITLSDMSSANAGEENPAVVSNQPLTNGTENTATSNNYIGDAGDRTGFYAFDTVQVQLLAVPDAHLNAAIRESVVRGALDYCAARGDCTVVGSAPDRGSGVTPRSVSDYNELESDYVDTVKGYSALFQASKTYGALYTPWIRVNDPIGSGAAPARFVPPDGHVMGVYARTEQERGIWKAPAGNAAQIRGALDVSATFTDEQHTDLVRNGFVNGIRRPPGAGIVVAASRTLSTDTLWWFVNVRLLFNFVKTSLRDGLRFVRQEPHTAELRRIVKFNVITPFLLGLWRGGAFGSGSPDEVFTIKCDAENNPPAEVNLGNFRVEVYFYPVRPAETIRIIVGQQPSGASVSEA